MADGIITPPISVASAVEGLKLVFPHLNTVPIVVGILICLFLIQPFGTQKIGKAFGPVMLVWFSFLAVTGFLAVIKNLSVFTALNPMYAIQLIIHYPKGFWLLGGIFLCTTGAEALYSDMGQVGRNNIRVSWIFVKISLILSYAGQTAWLLTAGKANSVTPFFNIVPVAIHVPAVALATLATIIASQALISGCFTLANEAIHLRLWPRHQIIFPGNIKGQIYIPFFNWSLMVASIAAVLYFQQSIKMQAAYGLSITLTMLSTTVLVSLYQFSRKRSLFLIIPITLLFLIIELSFLIANLKKFAEGGWIMMMIGIIISAIMLVWRKGRSIQTRMISYSKWEPDNVKQLYELANCNTVSPLTTHLIYFTYAKTAEEIETVTLDSIFTSPLKRADIYWFFYIDITDDPYTETYEIIKLSAENAYKVNFKIGFRIAPKFDLFFRSIATELINAHDVKRKDNDGMRFERSAIGSYKFVIMNSLFSFDNNLSFWDDIFMKAYYYLKGIATRQDIMYGLDPNNVIFEQYPVVYSTPEHVNLIRISSPES